MNIRRWALLMTLLLTAGSADAITVRAKYNPGGWLSRPSIDYWFTVDHTDPLGGIPTTSAFAINLGTFPLDSGSITVSGPNAPYFLKAGYAPGPPQNLSLIDTGGLGLMVGDTVCINSGPNPNSVIGFGNDVTWSVYNADRTALLPFQNTKTVPPPRDPTIGPAFTLVPEIGDEVLVGTGEPGTFISIFQNDPDLPAHGGLLDPTIRLAFGQVDPAGNFVLPLDSPLTGELMSLGVSQTDQDISDDGEIVAYIQPVPEPGGALAVGLAGISWIMRRRNG